MSRGNGLNRRGFIGKVGAASAAAGAVAHGIAPLAHGQVQRNVNMVLSQEPPTLAPGLGNAYVMNVVKQACGIEPPLTQRNDQNEWVPWVAKVTPTLETGLAYTVGTGEEEHLQVVFDLRDDVDWDDGARLTANDYVFGWELFMHPDYAVPSRSFSSKISSVVADGDYRLIVRFMSEREARDAAVNGRSFPGTYMPEYYQPAAMYAPFANQSGPVLDPNYYKSPILAAPRHRLLPIIEQFGVLGIAKHPYARKPAGIGPFKVTEWVSGQFIATERVPNFFLGEPKVPGIVFRIVSDTNAVMAQLATGEAEVVDSDALTEFNAPDLDRLQANGAITAHYTPGATWEHWDFNLDNMHLGDIRVRKAIAHSVNRQRIVDAVLNGKTAVIHSYAPAWRWDYNDTITKYDYNVGRARQLLEEAGYQRGSDGIYTRNGQKLSLKLQTTAGNQMRLLASQVAQQDLKEAGIEVNLEYVPAGEFFASGDNPGPLWGRRFEIGQYAWVGGDDPAPVTSLYGTTGIPKPENGHVGQNFPGFSNPRFDELVAIADGSIDQSKRKTAYDEAQQIWAESMHTLPLFARANTTATKRGLIGFRPTPTNTPPTWNAHEWSWGM